LGRTSPGPERINHSGLSKRHLRNDRTGTKNPEGGMRDRREKKPRDRKERERNACSSNQNRGERTAQDLFSNPGSVKEKMGNKGLPTKGRVRDKKGPK